MSDVRTSAPPGRRIVGMLPPWPIDPRGDALAQMRYIVWEFEGAKHGHRIVDDPDDHGGRTLSGLTRRCYSEDFLKMPKGTLCPVAVFDALTLDDVVAAMLEVFAMRTNIWQITPSSLRFIVLDYAMNAGAHDDAIPAMQRALGVEDDGVIGPATITALSRHRTPTTLCASVMDERYMKAARQCWKRGRPTSQVKFLVGWLDRFGRVMKLAAA